MYMWEQNKVIKDCGKWLQSVDIPDDFSNVPRCKGGPDFQTVLVSTLTPVLFDFFGHLEEAQQAVNTSLTFDHLIKLIWLIY